MPTITIKKTQKKIKTTKKEALMSILLENSIPVASSCNGVGVCGKCFVQIIEGADNLNNENEIEKFYKEKNNLKSNFRMSCQCEVKGDITVDASYW